MNSMVDAFWESVTLEKEGNKSQLKVLSIVYGTFLGIITVVMCLSFPTIKLYIEKGYIMPFTMKLMLTAMIVLFVILVSLFGSTVYYHQKRK